MAVGHFVESKVDLDAVWQGFFFSNVTYLLLCDGADVKKQILCSSVVPKKSNDNGFLFD